MLLLLVPILVVVCASISAAARDLPPERNSFAFTAATVPVALYTLPNGEGNSFTQAQPFDGLPNHDATITLHLRDGNDYPVKYYPAEDLWLESEFGGLMLPCPAGTIADFDTDDDGVTIWQLPLRSAGCNAPPEQLLIMIAGSPLAPGFDIHVNSPDLNGDGCVTLADIVLFVPYYMGTIPYDFCADFWWDGEYNVSDIVQLARGLGACCP